MELHQHQIARAKILAAPTEHCIILIRSKLYTKIWVIQRANKWSNISKRSCFFQLGSTAPNRDRADYIPRYEDNSLWIQKTKRENIKREIQTVLQIRKMFEEATTRKWASSKACEKRRLRWMMEPLPPYQSFRATQYVMLKSSARQCAERPPTLSHTISHASHSCTNLSQLRCSAYERCIQSGSIENNCSVPLSHEKV